MTDTKIPQQLRPFIEARREVGRTVREAVNDILQMSTQPLTVLEIQRGTERLVGRSIDSSHIRIVLQELQTSGLVSTRVETVEERLLRANGKATRGYVATLYWAHGGSVPARTVVEAIRGISLDFASRKPSRGRGRPKGSKNKSKKTSGPVATSNSVTVEVSALIDEIVRLRTLELQDKISVLEKKLAAIKSTLA